MEKLNKNQDTKFMILGGLGEIGKNMYLVEHDDEIIIIDAGISFADMSMLGIDYIVPDLIKEKPVTPIDGMWDTHNIENLKPTSPLMGEVSSLESIYA